MAGHFIAAMALAGTAGLTINYFTPAALIRGLAILRVGGRYAERLLTHDATLRVLAGLRGWLFRRLIPLAPARLFELRSAELFTRLRADVDVLEHFYLAVLVPCASASAVALLCIGVVGWVLPAALMPLSVALLAAGVGLSAWARRRAAADAARSVTDRAALRGLLLDALRGHGELLAFGTAARQRRRIVDLERQWVARELRLETLRAAGGGGTAFLAQAAVLAVLPFGVHAVSDGSLPPPALAMVCLLILAAFEALAPLPEALAGWHATRTAAARVFALTDRTPAVLEPPTSLPVLDPPAIAFRAVCLRYASDAPWALDGVDLELEVGARLAIVGPSGGGKSSLISALLKFYPLQGGCILFGGQPLAEVSGDLVRRRVAVIAQDSALFNLSLRDNLLLGRPRADAGAIARAGVRATAAVRRRAAARVGHDSRRRWGAGVRRRSPAHRRRPRAAAGCPAAGDGRTHRRPGRDHRRAAVRGTGGGRTWPHAAAAHPPPGGSGGAGGRGRDVARRAVVGSAAAGELAAASRRSVRRLGSVAGPMTRPAQARVEARSAFAARMGGRTGGGHAAADVGLQRGGASIRKSSAAESGALPIALTCALLAPLVASAGWAAEQWGWLGIDSGCATLTAFAVALLGAGMAVHAGGVPRGLVSPLALWLAGGVVILVGFGGLLFGSEPGRNAAPMWPNLHASVSLVLLGATLLLLGGKRGQFRGVVEVAAASAMFLPALALVAVFYAPNLPYARTPGASAVALVLLGVAALHVNRRRRLALWMPQKTRSGSLASGLLPAMIVTPVAIGLAELRVTEAEVLPPALAMALLVVLGMLVLMVLLFWNEELQLRLEAQRHHALVLAEEAARREAETDRLTGLLNRRGWEAALAACETLAKNEALEVCLLSLDVNGLKALNDNHGHHEGDRLLVAVSQALIESLREDDPIARLGGDEFAALLVGAGAREAEVIVARLERAFQRRGASVSVGVALRSAAGSLALAWHDADVAMYAHKQRQNPTSARSRTSTQPRLADG
ncbi:MAG: diguanylate cyclase [Gammaproteobacteria bacterium]|nr:diguanylate cyclase [Gammaproteobacteria bacterium]